MKLKTYRVVDLAMISILAFGIELLTTLCVNMFIPNIRPFPVIGMLLALVAITRWGWIGIDKPMIGLAFYSQWLQHCRWQ